MSLATYQWEWANGPYVFVLYLAHYCVLVYNGQLAMALV